ncbi:MAG: hypothetical protein QOD37_1158 [Gaiellales bacterium]|nr:hypothetical protein [Gaiellales bacterium]
MNEAHSGLARCLRTRELGRELLPVAHARGVRHLAMEALSIDLAARANAARELEQRSPGGYLGQPDMRALIDAALALGWTLHAYEADFRLGPARDGPEDSTAVNWREDQQARNLAAVVSSLSPSERILGWCGNGHLSRQPMTAAVDGERQTWTPMGSLVGGYCGLEPFSLDQTATVEWDGAEREWLTPPLIAALGAQGGTAGFHAAEATAEADWLGSSADAYVLSLDNALVE